MRKIPALCLALAAFFYASAAYSRICFLGDLDCQLGRFEAAEGVPCAEQGGDWVYEYDRCSQLVYGAPVCNDSTGNYYAPGTCPTGYTDMYSLSNQDKYICTSSTFGESCGVKCCKGSSATDEEGDIMCEADYVVCSNNSVGVGDSCTDKDGTKYKECICESTQYPYTCSETGLTANNSYDSCMDSSGNLYYAQCQCASGYTLTDTVTCENNCACDGTIIKPTPQLPGTNQYCWQGCRCNDDCEVNQCLIDFQSDFDTYWGGYDVNTKCNNLTIDCATLGYNSGRAGTGTTCKDGTEPYRCPFDHTQVYCESGLESSCEFTEKAECETAYFNSVCSIDGAGCYNPTACRTGYGKTVEVCSAGDAGNWSLGSTDEYGCARCLCETTCIDKVTPPANAEPVYEPCSACGSSTQIIIDFTCPTGYVKSSDGTSCEKVGCQDGYAKSAEECGTTGAEGYRLGTETDTAGCYKCEAYTSCTNHPLGGYNQRVVDGHTLCKKTNVYLGETEESCYSCVPCSEATNFPNNVTNPNYTAEQYCSSLPFNSGQTIGRTFSIFSDDEGRDGFCYYYTISEQMAFPGVSCDGCCRYGSYMAGENCSQPDPLACSPIESYLQQSAGDLD